MMGRNKILMILSSDGQGSGEGGLRQGRFRTMLSQVGLGGSKLRCEITRISGHGWHIDCLQVAKNMELNNSIDCELEIAGPGLCVLMFREAMRRGGSGELYIASSLATCSGPLSSVENTDAWFPPAWFWYNWSGFSLGMRISRPPWV